MTIVMDDALVTTNAISYKVPMVQPATTVEHSTDFNENVTNEPSLLPYSDVPQKSSLISITFLIT